jgi:cytochrome c oxidase subunit II
MTALIIFLCVILLSIVLVQVARVMELTAQIKGEKEVLRDNSKWNGWLSVGFVVTFLVACFASAYYYRNVMLGYGPHESASEHGQILDDAFNLTLYCTLPVFILTQIALFWFAYQYRWQDGRKVKYIPHDNRLEIWWTAIPAVVMTFLVVKGLDAWNTVMADVDENEEYMEIEATAQQFNWMLRYPGADNKLGARDYRLTTANNQQGIDFRDSKSWDDIVPGQELYLPVGKKVRVRIIAKDVLHNFYLPHFRVKMDAVPGMPTYFVFTPTKTTAEYRQELSKYPEYNELYDPADPKGGKRWEKFDYELACAELCGKGHYSMRRILKIVTPEEYEAWIKKQESFYLSQIREKPEDPNLGKVLDIEVGMRAKAFGETMKKAVESTAATDKTLRLKYVNFETGSATLTADSRYELDNLVKAMNDYPTLTIEVAGHTDNVGEAAANMALSNLRAQSVASYLSGKGITAGRLRPRGYGDTKPVDPAADNNTDENRAKNRRTEFTILGGAPVN